MADIRAALTGDAAGSKKAAANAKKTGKSYYGNPALMALLEKAGMSFTNGYSVQEEGTLLQDLMNKLQGGYSYNYTNSKGVAMSGGSTPIMELTSEYLNNAGAALTPGTKFDAISTASIQTFIDKQKAQLDLATAQGFSSVNTAQMAADIAKAQKLITPVVKAVAKAPKKIPKLAAGGFVNRPTHALIGEAGPEVVTPLKDFERMIGIGDFERRQNRRRDQKVIHYHAAPNESIDREEALFKAMRRAKVVAGW